MSKPKWYVITEEGIEGEGSATPLDALVDYVNLGDTLGTGEQRINEIVQGQSEINGVQAFTKAELDAMPES